MKHKALRIASIVFAAYLILGALFYFIAGDSLHFTKDTTDTVSSKGVIAEFAAGDDLEQKFTCPFDELESFSIKIARAGDSIVGVKLYEDGSDTPVFESETKTKGLRDDADYRILLEKPIKNAKGKTFKVRLENLSSSDKNSVTFYYGNTVDSGRFSIQQEIDENEVLYVEGQPQKDSDGNTCTLCLTVTGINRHFFGPNYWYFYGGGALLIALWLGYLLLRRSHGKSTLALDVIQSLSKYSFLIRQLVSRDFKTKYKRSVLGMLWSFLNPLLTMSIQYVVFSTIFRSNIDNFAVYLLCGIVCFNFFNEATNMCLMSIVSNASLINKVYVPKYIYPFSRTLSSSINLLLSLVPLFIMLLVTQTPITTAILLLPFALLMLFMLSYGVGLLLATMMVFFRDTQFLWGIFSMLLMYLTPVFYPESIIPAQFMTVYKLNPLYHVLRFIRSILMNGASLEPKAYLYCFVLCAIPFLIGVIVFRKNQDKFVLNI